MLCQRGILVRVWLYINGYVLTRWFRIQGRMARLYSPKRCAPLSLCIRVTMKLIFIGRLTLDAHAQPSMPWLITVNNNCRLKIFLAHRNVRLGIIARDGRNIKFTELTDQLRNTYNVSPTFSRFIPNFAAEFMRKNYGKGTFDLEELDLHNEGIEHDGSLCRTFFFWRVLDHTILMVQ